MVLGGEVETYADVIYSWPGCSWWSAEDIGRGGEWTGCCCEDAWMMKTMRKTRKSRAVSEKDLTHDLSGSKGGLRFA